MSAQQAAALTATVLTQDEALAAPRTWIANQHFAAGEAIDERWLTVLRDGLRHIPLCIEARRGGGLAGVLPLALVESRLFGRFLVSLPYLSVAGVFAEDELAAGALVDRAVSLAEEHRVRYLELRHAAPLPHRSLELQRGDKMQMRLPLPGATEALWRSLKAKVRNQVRKAESHELEVVWGGEDRLRDFYAVFSRNMRDLGTPVYPRRLFQAMLEHFPSEAEICVVRKGGRPIASALLIHGPRESMVPSGSALREFNGTNANMLMYWHLLARSVERGQPSFDFGRSTKDSGTYRFKKQWGAMPVPTTWQYYLRRGTAEDMRPGSAKNAALSKIWRRLPLPLTRWIGPSIVRGIP